MANDESQMCFARCGQCRAGDDAACRAVSSDPLCADVCPPTPRDMGQGFDAPPGPALDDAPLASALGRFAADRDYWDPPEDEGRDRDGRVASYAGGKGAGRNAMTPAQLSNREDAWGGGLRRMTAGGVGPRREDEHRHAARHVPIGFGRYVSPTIDPGDYSYYQLAGWRVAVPRTALEPAVRALLLRIHQYGPGPAGYARLGDTLVPATLGPGDRQTLAETESRLGAAALR